MEFVWSMQAKKDLSSLDASVRSRIASKMRWYAAQPNPLAFAKPLVGVPGISRFRIGTYRVLIHPDGTVLLVLRIAKRSEDYG